MLLFVCARLSDLTRTHKTKKKKDWLAHHVAVLDDRGEWLQRWRRQFDGLGIQHLRSTSGAHVDPHDSYGLTAFADDAGRAAEVAPLRHIEKDASFHGPFHVPGSALFDAHCRDCIARYAVGGAVTRAKVFVFCCWWWCFVGV